MPRTTIAIDPSGTKLRRVGRLARRRMRIDGHALVNGRHTDGTLTVDISGFAAPVAGVPDSFEWASDRPIALVIIRSGIDGDDVAFAVGPSRHGIVRGASPSDGAGIRYVAFCYDAAPDTATVDTVAAPVARLITPVRRRIAAARSLAPTGRDRRSILDQLFPGSPARPATT